MPKQLAFPTLLTLILSSCGNIVTNSISTPTCQSRSVLILVGDNFLNPICGCQEIAGQTTPPSSPTLTCTFSNNSSVIFDFTGTKQTHQIRFSSGSVLPDSPSYNLSVNKYPTAYGFTVTTTGSFSFTDAMNPNISGTLISL